MAFSKISQILTHLIFSAYVEFFFKFAFFEELLLFSNRCFEGAVITSLLIAALNHALFRFVQYFLPV